MSSQSKCAPRPLVVAVVPRLRGFAESQLCDLDKRRRMRRAKEGRGAVGSGEALIREGVNEASSDNHPGYLLQGQMYAWCRMES
jgi:hypothetical protein